MIEYLDNYDVAVIGGGHAGVEAALAAARLGMKTVMFSISLDCIANLPCNPSIGGTAKGHLVREIDALGGEMGKAADETFIQSKMLNRGKGPAVHSLRVQSDRTKYHLYMKKCLEETQNLYVRASKERFFKENISLNCVIQNDEKTKQYKVIQYDYETKVDYLIKKKLAGKILIHVKKKLFFHLVTDISNF